MAEDLIPNSEETPEQNEKSKKDIKKPIVLEYSFTQFMFDIKLLAEKIASVRIPKHILTVATGGLIPATILARRLKCNSIKTVCLKSYSTKSQNEVLHKRVLGFTEEISNNPKDWLIVDDIVKTGKTLQWLRNKYPNIPVATIFANPSSVKPDFFIQESEIYVRFPWE